MILNLNPRVVSFHYTLKDKDGQVLESSFGSDPLMFLEGVGQIIPGLEEAIKAMQAGDKKTVMVKAKDAYGEVEADMIVEVPRERLPKPDVAVGDRFHADAGQVITLDLAARRVESKMATPRLEVFSADGKRLAANSGLDSNSDPFLAFKAPAAGDYTARVTETHATIDGNHPLAGQDLTFEVAIDSTRNATDEEMKHGHAHGPGGHNH